MGRLRKKKNFRLEFRSTRPWLENSKKNSKKIQNIKKHYSDNIYFQTGLRQVEKEKKKSSRIPYLPNPSQKIPKKNSQKIKKIKKHHSNTISIQTGLSQAEKEKKKNFIPNSIPSQPGQENSKKNCQKINKHHSCNISIQAGLRQVEKEKKKIRLEFCCKPTRARTFQKKLPKISKN